MRVRLGEGKGGRGEEKEEGGGRRVGEEAREGGA